MKKIVVCGFVIIAATDNKYTPIFILTIISFSMLMICSSLNPVVNYMFKVKIDNKDTRTLLILNIFYILF